jgi:hypothetical protein
LYGLVRYFGKRRPLLRRYLWKLSSGGRAHWRILKTICVSESWKIWKNKLTVDVAAHETYPTGLTIQNHNNGDITGEGSALMGVILAVVDPHDTWSQSTATPNEGSKRNSANLWVSVVLVGVESCVGSANARWKGFGWLAA